MSTSSGDVSMSPLTKLGDLARAEQLGVSLTELHRRRREWSEQVVGPAVEAYERTLAHWLNLVNLPSHQTGPQPPSPHNGGWNDGIRDN